MVKVENLTEQQLDEIGRAIGDSFFDHDCGEGQKGIAKFITDREMMFRYMRAIFAAGVKSGMVYSTSERGEAYIMLSYAKGEKLNFGQAIKMLLDLINALGGFRKTVFFLKELRKGGEALDDQMKKEKEPFLKVEMVVVLKPYQGQGYMRKLMEFAYAKADAYGVDCILDTDAKNKLEKYCHLGMELVQTRKIADDCYFFDLRRKKL